MAFQLSTSWKNGEVSLYFGKEIPTIRKGIEHFLGRVDNEQV